MFNTILVAVDGSGHSNHAAKVGADLASRYEATLVVAHVMTSGPVPAALSELARAEHLLDESRSAAEIPDAETLLRTRGPVADTERQQLHAAIGAHLTARAERDARRMGVKKVEIDLLDGDPARAILASIERHGVDLAVLGSRGLSDLGGLLMGSVSHKVCQLAPCSCVTVK